MHAAGFAPGSGGYSFSEDQAQRIFEELFGRGFGGLGGGMGGGLGGGMGGAGGPRVRVFSSGPGGGGLGRRPANQTALLTDSTHRSTILSGVNPWQALCWLQAVDVEELYCTRAGTLCCSKLWCSRAALA